jgi:hypothetical protein
MPKPVITYVDDELHQRFKRLCGGEGCRIYDKVADLIRGYVESQERSEKEVEKDESEGDRGGPRQGAKGDKRASEVIEDLLGEE